MTAVAIGLMAIGTGISAYSSYQSGKMQSYAADMNAAQQERNATNQLMAMQTQANLMKREAEANAALRGMEAKAMFANATAIEQQAIGQDAINRVNLKNRRDEMSRSMGQQRAAIAASGIVEASGTPLDILAETAGLIQRDQEEQNYTFELNRRTLFREAQLERLGGRMALAGASLDRQSGVAAAGLQGAAARAEYLSNMRGAQITRFGGDVARRTGNLAAGATLLSGLGQAGGMYFNAS